MYEPSDIPSELLARYVAGEADVAERERVEQWADAAPENRRELDAMLTIWELGSEAPAGVDVDAAWTKVQARMEGEGAGGRVIALWRSNAVRWAAAAAVLVGLFLLARDFGVDEQEMVAAAQATTSFLDDSTAVVLSPNSRLESRMGSERHITLHGKAWFEVKRDENHPFVVDAGELRITVLGTGFDVAAYDTADQWTVRVRHGRVRVQAKDQVIELSANERASFDRRTGELKRGVPVTVEAWGDRIIQFQNAALGDVAAEIERIYHVRIELMNEAVGRCRLTASFEEEPIDQVLRVIGGTFGLRVSSVAADHFQLDGDGC